MPSELYNWIRDILAATVGSTIAGAAARNTPASADQRAELLLDFQQLPQDAAAVLWKRHRAGLDRHRENQFVIALTKIPPARRREVLLRLAQANDADFEQALTLLSPENGRAGEAVVRAGEAAVRLDAKLKPLADRLRKIEG